MPWWTARSIYAHLIWSRCRRCAEHGAIPGVLHRQSAQLMNKIGKIRDELLHVQTSSAAVAFLSKCSRVKYERFAPYPSLSPGVSRCRRCQRCRGSVEGVSRECRLTLVSRCRGCRGSVDGDLDIRDALMLSRCQRCQGGGWAHGQSKLIGVQSVPTAQGMSPYHNTSPQYTLEPQRRGLSTFPA